jgi:hypothetical protein
MQPLFGYPKTIRLGDVCNRVWTQTWEGVRATDRGARTDKTGAIAQDEFLLLPKLFSKLDSHTRSGQLLSRAYLWNHDLSGRTQMEQDTPIILVVVRQEVCCGLKWQNQGSLPEPCDGNRELRQEHDVTGL